MYILAKSPWYLYHKYFVVSLHIGDFTFIVHAQKRQSERRENVTVTTAFTLSSQAVP